MHLHVPRQLWRHALTRLEDNVEYSPADLGSLARHGFSQSLSLEFILGFRGRSHDECMKEEPNITYTFAFFFASAAPFPGLEPFAFGVWLKPLESFQRISYPAI